MMFEGYAARQSEHRQELLYLAWHIEAFARQKRLPKLEKVLRETAKKKRTQKRIGKAELIAMAKSKGLTGPW